MRPEYFAARAFRLTWPHLLDPSLTWGMVQTTAKPFRLTRIVGIVKETLTLAWRARLQRLKNGNHVLRRRSQRFLTRKVVDHLRTDPRAPLRVGNLKAQRCRQLKRSRCRPEKRSVVVDRKRPSPANPAGRSNRVISFWPSAFSKTWRLPSYWTPSCQTPS